MNAWMNRPQEERALLNPAFCAALLWHAALARKATKRQLAFEECFVILPLVLPASVREMLPGTTATPLTNWLNANPLEQRRFVVRSRLLVPFTRTALLFGCTRGFFNLAQGAIIADEKWRSKVRRFERESSAEVQVCIQKAKMVSKWFLKTGDASTVLALLGVRP